MHSRNRSSPIQNKYDLIILDLFVCAFTDAGYLDYRISLGARKSLSRSAFDVKGHDSKRCDFGPLPITGQCFNVVGADVDFELAPSELMLGHDFVARVYLVPSHAHNLLVDHEA